MLVPQKMYFSFDNWITCRQLQIWNETKKKITKIDHANIANTQSLIQDHDELYVALPFNNFFLLSFDFCHFCNYYCQRIANSLLLDSSCVNGQKRTAWFYVIFRPKLVIFEFIQLLLSMRFEFLFVFISSVPGTCSFNVMIFGTFWTLPQSETSVWAGSW